MIVLQILGTEWIFVILVVMILLFGSKKVPELAKSLGKAMGEFQKGRLEIEREIKAATQAVQEPINEMKNAIQTPITETTQAIKDSIQAPIAETTQAIKETLTLKPQLPKTSPIEQSSLPHISERDRLEKAARDLGILPEGKTDEQLREEIRKALS